MAITFLDGAPLHVPTLEAYWRDPRSFEAERQAWQARINALFADHDARVRAEQEARWAAEEAATWPDDHRPSPIAYGMGGRA